MRAGFLFAERTLVPWRARPVGILMQSSKTRKDESFAEQECTTAATNQPCPKVVDAKLVRLTLCPHTPVMVTSTRLGFLLIKPKILRPSRWFSHVEGRIIEVVPCQLFYVLLTNLSEKQVIIPKHMIKAHKEDRPQLVASTKGTL